MEKLYSHFSLPSSVQKHMRLLTLKKDIYFSLHKWESISQASYDAYFERCSHSCFYKMINSI